MTDLARSASSASASYFSRRIPGFTCAASRRESLAFSCRLRMATQSAPTGRGADHDDVYRVAVDRHCTPIGGGYPRNGRR